jgi:hypothetical protein
VNLALVLLSLYFVFTSGVSLLTYAETVECLDGGSCLIEDLLNSLLRILSESLLD